LVHLADSYPFLPSAHSSVCRVECKAAPWASHRPHVQQTLRVPSRGMLGPACRYRVYWIAASTRRVQGQSMVAIPLMRHRQRQHQQTSRRSPLLGSPRAHPRASQHCSFSTAEPVSRRPWVASSSRHVQGPPRPKAGSRRNVRHISNPLPLDQVRTSHSSRCVYEQCLALGIGKRLLVDPLLHHGVPLKLRIARVQSRCDT
jgi:hypothetical protein